ncbi:MAG: TonB-dependent receptor [Pseudomonadota bacterium]|nr:TonB-dependent receptor [Pseudomonadota bacterium]
MKATGLMTGAAVAALSAALGGVPALAQQLDVITVTAQKREQDVTDVPIAISVVTGETLDDFEIGTLDDLQLSVPNFQVTQTGIGTQMYIRGIGTGNDPAFEQSVAQFIDGVSYGRARLTRAPFFDLERVEVLRGPQSVLFGKNTTGGALSLITARPTMEFEAGIDLSYMFDTEEAALDAYVSGPISENLSGRLALRAASTGGFVATPNLGEDGPQHDDFAVRGTLFFTPTHNFDATLKVEHNSFDVEGREIEVSQDVATGPLTYAQALNAVGLTGAMTNTRFDFIRDADTEEYSNNTVSNVTLTTNTDFDAGTLTTVTGYVSYDRDEIADLDFTNYYILTGLVTEEYEQFSQEIRFSSDTSERLSWIGGVYFQSSTLDTGDVTGFGGAIANLGYGPLANVGIERAYEQDSTAYAVFAEGTFNATDRLRLIGGLRWTYEEKDASRQIVATTSPNSFGAPLATNPATLGILSAGLGVALNNPGMAGHDLNQSREEDRLTPSIMVEFDATDTLMLFASYKEGFKGGGFDVRGNSTAFFEFDDETVTSYEAGLRSDLLGGRMQFNATAYFAQYENLQISQFDGTIGFNVGNAGETEIAGVDLDTRIALTDELTLSAGLSYLDFEYTDFRRGNCAFGETPDGDIVNGVQLCDYTGRRGRFTPETTGFARLDYVRQMQNGVDFVSTLNVGYTGEHNIHDNLDSNGEVDAYTLVDLRVGLDAERWGIALVGRNLFDEEILTFSANVPFASSVGANTHYAVPLRPQVFGVQGSLRF